MLALLIFIIAILLSLAAVLSATETAITATSPGKIQKIKSEGDKRADIVLRLIKIKERVISTLLIGYSITTTVCTTIATGLFINIMGDDRGTIISSITMSFVIIVFAEVIPKAIAVAKAERISMFTAPIIEFLVELLHPVNYLLGIIVKIFCLTFRINLKTEISGADEVRGVIEHHHLEGNVYKYDRDMLEGVLDIRDMTVSEIMVHRSNMVTIDINLEKDKIVEAALSSSYSRIPMWKGNKDNIIGILNTRDLLRVLYKNGNDHLKINLDELITPPWFIPDNALVIHQLHTFRENNKHFACVVDEYGDLQGIITSEDILEEIVGPIRNKFDNSTQCMIIKKSRNEFIINGATTIRDINRELDWNLSDEYANTIAGLIIHEIERIPNQGEVLEILNLRITIHKKVTNRIDTIKVRVLPSSDK